MQGAADQQGLRAAAGVHVHMACMSPSRTACNSALNTRLAAAMLSCAMAEAVTRPSEVTADLWVADLPAQLMAAAMLTRAGTHDTDSHVIAELSSACLRTMTGT